MSDLVQAILVASVGVALSIHTLSFLITRRIEAKREAACEHAFEPSKTMYCEDGVTSDLPIKIDMFCTKCGAKRRLIG